MSSNIICVLGMHRSGTSCLAGCLEEAGAHWGKVGDRAKHNPKGNRELSSISKLNDRVMNENGGTWRQPPRGKIIWSREQQQERDDVIESFEGQSTWGFKDPRTLVTFAGWEEALPQLRIIGTVRDPRLVAQSLQSRAQQEFLWEQAIWLWWEYNRRLLAIWKRRPFPIINFGLDGEAYISSVRKAARELALPTPQSISFFEEQHRRQSDPIEQPVSATVSALYNKILEISVKP